MDADFCKAQLRVIWLNRGSSSLLDALNNRLKSLVAKTQDGTFLASTSANGVSASFFSGKTFDAADATKFLNRLLEYYEQSVAQGFTDDQDIYYNILFMLEPVTEFTFDHSTGRDSGV